MQYLIYASLSVLSQLRDELQRVIESSKRIDPKYAAHSQIFLHYYSKRCQSINLLPQDWKLWDCNIIMRAALECATRFPFVSIAPPEECGLRIDEYTILLNEIEDLQRSERAKPFVAGHRPRSIRSNQTVVVPNPPQPLHHVVTQRATDSICSTGQGRKETTVIPVSSKQLAARLVTCLSRILRANAAPTYLSMCRAEFNKTVRPYVREFRIGVQALASIERNWTPRPTPTSTRPALKRRVTGHDHSRSERHGAKPWREQPLAASTKETGSGTSTRSSEISEFRKALDQVTGRRRSST